MEFTTEIKDSRDISLYKLADYIGIQEVDFTVTVATIKWFVDIEARGYGIKGVIHVISDVHLQIEYYYYEDDDLECETILEKVIYVDGKDFQIEDKMEFMKDGQLYPQEVEVDFKTKTITIS